VNNYLFLTRHSNITIKNVSWPHFSWATLYSQVLYHLYNSDEKIDVSHLRDFSVIETR